MSFTTLYDSIVHHPDHDNATESLLIFLLPGNPGLVSYYTTYLAHLHAICSAALPRHIAVHIYSCSMSGFAPHAGTHLRDLDGQIEYMDAALGKAWDQVGAKAKVVLVGHSIGAYMLLEILRRRRGGQMRVVGGVCLTPTVVDLAGSPSGKKVGWIGSKTWFAPAAAGLAKALLWPWPDATLFEVVKWATGMPDDAARTTLRFLRSERGIHQALHLLRFELAQLTVDRWDDELWGVAAAPGRRTKLFFYFARNDQWVADETRNQLIAARSSASSELDTRPDMEINEAKLPHAFCIRHSEEVAEKTLEYIRKLVQSNWD